MSEDKAVQTFEEEFYELPVPSPTPSPGLLHMDNYEELVESIHDLLEEYIKAEVIHMSKESFMTQLNDDIAHVLFQI
jgi:hypothetical protein